MRVAMITRDLNFGLGSHVIGLVKRLRQLNVDVNVYEGFTDLRTNFLAEKISRRDDYDLIHVQGSPYAALLWKKKPVVLTVHTTLASELKYKSGIKESFGAFFELQSLAKADKIIVVNKILGTDLIINYNVQKEKIEVITNAVDVNEFSSSVDVPRADYVFSCGRLTPRKDFETLISACGKAGVRLFLSHGALTREDLTTHYKTARVFVCSSLYETGPITVMEAMAAKCPVICSDIPAVEDLVIDGKTGLLFEPRNSDDLAEKINFLFNDSDYAKKLAKRAYIHVKKHFNWMKVAEETKKLYEEVLS